MSVKEFSGTLISRKSLETTFFDENKEFIIPYLKDKKNQLSEKIEKADTQKVSEIFKAFLSDAEEELKEKFGNKIKEGNIIELVKITFRFHLSTLIENREIK